MYNNIIYNNFKSFKYLTFKKKSKNPGLFAGKKIIRTRGSGLSRKFRKIDVLHSLWNQRGCIVSIDYDPNNKKLISLVLYLGGYYSYTAHIIGSFIGMMIMSSYKSSDSLGNSMFVQHFTYGSNIHNLEIKPKSGAKLLRANGSFGKVLNSINNYKLIKLKSGKIVKIPFDSLATSGIISDFFHLYYTKKKNAGYWRLLGWRPMVRGVAMNAVDHPHGGGKGKKSGNALSMSPWGALAKGKKTSINRCR